MTAYLLAGPAIEPVTLADAKAFLRVDSTAEDGLISTLVAAARLHVEATTARALIAQSWRLVLDCWPLARVVPLPVGPVLTLTAVTAYDEAGDGTEVELEQFQVETGVAPARLLLPAEIEDMPVLRERQGIEIDYAAGYGADREDVPMDLKHAILTLVGYWFEHRDAVIVAGAGAVVPTGFDRLVAPYKRVRL
jgi:uncharacterized phiE125 gp8 family phage protein